MENLETNKQTKNVYIKIKHLEVERLKTHLWKKRFLFVSMIALQK